MKFLACLVASKVFEVVELYFLPVGHTHAEIDQRWSVLSRYLDSVDCFTLHQMMSSTQEAFRKSDTWFQQELVEEVVDFDALLDPVTEKLHGLGTSRDDRNVKRRVHCIKFSHNDGHCDIVFKEFDSCKEEWKGHHRTNKPLRLLQEGKTFPAMATLPLIPREDLKDFEKVQAKVSALQSFLKPCEELEAAIPGTAQFKLVSRIKEATSSTWSEFFTEEQRWQETRTQKGFSSCLNWPEHRFTVCADNVVEMLDQLDDPDHADNEGDKLPYVGGRAQLHVGNKDKPKSKYTFDPTKNIEHGDCVILLMETEGSTDNRGWELGLVTDVKVDEDAPLRPITSVTVTYLSPGKNWEGEWWKRSLRKIYKGRHEWWDEVDTGVVLWSIPLTKRSKIKHKNMAMMLQLIADCEGYHAAHPGAGISDILEQGIGGGTLPSDVDSEDEEHDTGGD